MPAHPIELPQGTLDLLILQALALEPQHGWAISERVQQISSDALRIQQGPSTLRRLGRRAHLLYDADHIDLYLAGRARNR
jgi:hypothetical protein